MSLQLASIVKKVMDKTAETVDLIVSNDTPFGIPTNPFSSGKKTVRIFKASNSHNTALLYRKTG